MLGMGVPLSDERHCTAAIAPELHSQHLMAIIASVEHCARAAVSQHWLRAFQNFDMGTAVGTDEDSAGFGDILRRSRIACDGCHNAIGKSYQTQPGAKNHFRRGPHAGQESDGARVVSLT